MAEYLAPGVYVEEVERGARPIEGVSTSTAGFLGPTERGPTRPQLVTSFSEYKNVYGGILDDSYLANAVNGFFTNGGGRCYVGRVTASTETADGALAAGSGDADPEPAAGTLWPSTDVLDFGDAESGSKSLTVRNLGAPGEDDAIVIVEDDLAVSDETVFGVETESGDDVTIEPGESASLTVTYDEPAEPVTATVTIPHDGENSPLEVELRGGSGAIGVRAVGPGAWGGHVAVFVGDSQLYERGENELFRLVVRYWADADDLATAKRHHGSTESDEVPEPDVEEVFDDLSPVKSSSNFYEKQVNGASSLVELTRLAPGRPAKRQTPTWLSGPDDDPEPDYSAYDGSDEVPPDERTGLAGFGTVDDISIVCIPDEHRIGGLTDALVEHCETMGDRFAIIQAEQNPGNPGDIEPSYNSDYAGFYYPWLSVINPETGVEESVPPGGHVAGIFARSDAQHGVHKAPANEVVRGVQQLTQTVTKGAQESLNPKGVNCIRSFRGRGIRVWGARTTSSDPLWKYVNVRRLFLYLEESIYEGTQWVVFEPNNEELWARVEQTIRNFLTGVWDDGALMGSTPDEAFYVKCDRTTMTQSDIDNGRLICEIGVAPTKPAEFVVFRISQWTGGAE